MRKKSLICLTLFCSVLLCLPISKVMAEDIKMGHIDLQRAIRESKQGKEKRDELEKEVKKKQAEIKSLGDGIKAMESEFKEKELMLSEEAKTEMGESIQNKLLELKRLQDDSRTKLQKIQRKSIEQLMKVILKVVKNFGKESGYTVIVNSLDDNFLYLDKGLDITSKIIEILNKQ